jgi:starvation-inducible outer membrane lipoprotein
MIKCAATVGLACLISAAWANAPETPEQSLDADLSGPRVEWTGVIVDRIEAMDETCFVLDRSRVPIGDPLPRARFAVCDPGIFNEVSFGVGKELKVTGNLGARKERLIGSTTLEAPLIAAARIELGPEYHEHADPWSYDPYGSYNPGHDRFGGRLNMWYWDRW